MKHRTARFLASLAILVTGGSAFGQYQQVSHCDCDGSSGSYVGYQATDWNHCDSCQNGNHHGRKHRRNDPCNDRRGLRNNPISRCIQSKAYPESGWAPPLHYPVNHDGVWYGAYHPQAFYGSPGGGFIGNYPTVYQPNDTTQLGYIYHKVPTWQTRTDMIPPTPFPGNFHNRGYLYGSHGCFGGGHHGGVYHGGYSQPCQSCQSGYVTEYQAMPNQVEYAMQQPVPQAQMHVAHQAPQRTQIVRPAAKKSGFGGLRLASLTELFD